jgi:hypothetical protein
VAKRDKVVELQKESSAVNKPVKVRLNEFTFEPEIYRHRDRRAVDPENAAIQELANSVVVEGGILAPVEVAVKKGKYVVISGHRRLAAVVLLIRRNEPGFTEDMEIPAILVEGTEADLFVRSLSSNALREELDEEAKFAAIRKAVGLGVSDLRAALALDMPASTYARYAKLARCQRMDQFVRDDLLTMGDALKLIGAVPEERYEALCDDLALHFAGVKTVIDERSRRRIKDTGEDLKPAQKQVKNNLGTGTVAGWVKRIEKGEQILGGSPAPYVYPARIDEAKQGAGATLVVPGLRLDLIDPENYEKVVTVAARLHKLSEQLLPYADKLKRLQDAGAGVAGKDDQEAEFLRKAGHPEAASRLDRQRAAERAAARPTGADPNFGKSRPRRAVKPVTGVTIEEGDGPAGGEANS